MTRIVTQVLQKNSDDERCLRKAYKQAIFEILTLRRPNVLGVHGPVSPDLTKTVKVRSDQSENLTNVFDGAKNGNCN